MADLPCSAPGVPEGQGFSLIAVQPNPHDGLAAPSPHTTSKSTAQRPEVLAETSASLGLLRVGTCRVRHLEDLHGALGGPLARTSDPGPQTLEMGTFPPFPEAQQTAEHLAARSQALLWGQAWTRPSLWCLISLPCWFVAQFIPGSWLVTDPTESQMVPPAESWNSRTPPACSPQAKPCFCHPEISLFQPPHLIPVWP